MGTGWVRPTTTRRLPAALRQRTAVAPRRAARTPASSKLQEQSPGPPAEDDQPFPSPVGLLLLGQEAEDSVPSPPSHQRPGPALPPLGRDGAQRHRFLASFLLHLFLFPSLELLCICFFFSPGGFPY